MAIKDTDVIDWLPANLDNSPGDGNYISSTLAPQFRNLKSAYRILSKNKGQERPNPKHLSDPLTSPTLGVTIFNLAGNLLNLFQPNRKILARSPTGQIAPGSVVSAHFFYQNSPYTQVIATMWDGGTGGWTANNSELMIGIDRESPEVFPMTMLGGCVRFDGSTSSQNVLLTAAASSTGSSVPSTIDRRVIMPTKAYMVHLTPCFSNLDSGSGTELIIKSVTKYYNKFTVNLFNSDGPGTGKTVIFDWFITRPMENL